MKNLTKSEIRHLCRTYAQRFVEIQKHEFKRLGIFGTWDEPYLTMSCGYEAQIAREIGALMDSGAVYVGDKPVYWCSSCRTALAEAEVEYADRESPSIYVKFRLDLESCEVFQNLVDKEVSIVIWTTTPWTIPANLAVALNPDFEYAAFEAPASQHSPSSPGTHPS